MGCCCSKRQHKNTRLPVTADVTTQTRPTADMATQTEGAMGPLSKKVGPRRGAATRPGFGCGRGRGILALAQVEQYWS